MDKEHVQYYDMWMHKHKIVYIRVDLQENVHSNQSHGIIISRQAHTERYQPHKHDGGASDEKLSPPLQVSDENHDQHRKQFHHPCDGDNISYM